MNRLTHISSSGVLRLFVLALVGLAWVGCGPPPLKTSQMEEPALSAIHATFVRVVEDAHEHPELKWHSGWLGNIWVNSLGDDHLGLCYHWQEWVYAGVVMTVEEVGWEATGLVINEQTNHEHHAVLVYDPQRSNPVALLESPTSVPSYVLDAWRRGRPDTYRLADWLALPTRIEVPVREEPLPYFDEGEAEEAEPAADGPIESTSPSHLPSSTNPASPASPILPMLPAAPAAAEKHANPGS